KQATSTRGVRARIRSVAGCATPTGSAGHAGATANLKLTFHLDHSAGADQSLHSFAQLRQNRQNQLLFEVPECQFHDAALGAGVSWSTMVTGRRELKVNQACEECKT